MTIQDVAQLLGRTTNTVRRYCRGEDLPHRREAGRLVFDEGQVREWMSRPEIAAFLGYGEMVKHGRQAAQAAGTAA